MPAAWRPVFVSFSVGTIDQEYKEVVRLPSNIKKVGAIKLVGCRQNVATLALLDIKEAQTNNGELLTNTEVINSNFFALPKTDFNAVPLWDSSAEGLRCVSFTPRNMTTLTLQLKDTNNSTLLQTGAASIQCDIWLRILTECDD